MNLAQTTKRLGLLAALACSTSETSGNSRTITLTEASPIPMLGQGYLAESDELRAICLKGSTRYLPHSESLLQLELSLSEEQLKEEIAAQFAGGINVFLASAKLTNKLSSRLNQEDSRHSLIFKASFRTKDEVLAEPEPTALALQLLHINDPKTNLANCGREYVKGISHGGQIYISLDFSFRSKAIKNAITSKAEFKVLGLKKAKTFLKTIEHYTSAITIEVDAFQIGGSPEKLAEILATHPRQACTVEDFNACDQLIERLLNYATDPHQFLADLDQSPIAFTTESYKSSGFAKLVNESSPYLTGEALLAFQELAMDQERYLKKSKKVRQLLSSPLVTRQQRNQLYFVQESLEQNVLLLRRALSNCTFAPHSCTGARAAVQNSLIPIDDTLLSPWRNFYYYCKLADPEQQKGIRAVLEKLRVESCEQGLTHIDQIEELDLSELQLKRLDFISSLPKLKALNISKNKLQDLFDLSGLKNLRALNASQNLIENLEGIKELTHLEQVSVAKNFIRSLEPLYSLSSLTFISAYDNLLSDTQNLAFLQNATKILSSQEACIYQSKKLIAEGAIDQETVTLYHELGLGPYFLPNQAPRWINCELASKSYPE